MSKDKLTKHTLFLFAGDYQRLAELYPGMSTAIIIRNLIRNHIAKVAPPIPTDQVTTGDINV